ncbi:L-histidine N(alpha)-methyltransferase [Microbulbifer discodermiae]|uniref:L-histidine N(alpha)-methyltransferase n=1 Tax=Microbulbifer sp. 2201CG32-9 TaxID=3232309 RepID=UPI00345C5BAC
MNMPLRIVRDDNLERTEFLRNVLAGLRSTQKTLPCKYLYDETGSRLFERICELQDYYVTRTEAEIFSDYLHEMAARIGPKAVIIEPGAGNCEKVEPLLAKLADPVAYVPMDISPEILLEAKARIRCRLPNLTVREAIGDFTCSQIWEGLSIGSGRNRVIFFPGSTVGNFEQEEAQQLLSCFASALTSGDGLLVGTDLDKDSVVLERAYHDSEHLTEAFNKNLLVRINNELGGSFDLSLFAHRAFYHPLRKRIEMHLVCLASHKVTVAGEEISFLEGETIHTENSHKYTIESFNQLLCATGFTPVEHWLDPGANYAVHYAQKT